MTWKSTIVVKEVNIFLSVKRLKMSGWMPLTIDTSVYIKMAVIGICSYAAVALLELLKMRKDPLGMALKEAAI